MKTPLLQLHETPVDCGGTQCPALSQQFVVPQRVTVTDLPLQPVQEVVAHLAPHASAAYIFVTNQNPRIAVTLAEKRKNNTQHKNNFRKTIKLLLLYFITIICWQKNLLC